VSAAVALSVDDLLARARVGLQRLDPVAAYEAWLAGATLVDIRPAAQRRSEGEVPGALVVERNVLEWRFDPASDARLPEASYHLQVLVLCSQGYTSSLAADALQQLGVGRATDVIGGFQAWLQAGLPTTSGSALTPVSDRELGLIRLEIDLLACLVGSPLRVHTHRQLMDAVWPPNVDAGSRTVDGHVQRLRARLGWPWAESLITVRGVGYCWAPRPAEPENRSTE
jgi:DNA-binding response OmpR family regulator